MKTEQDTTFKIDCIAMKRKIQEEIYLETKDMTPEQRLAYYHELAAKSRWGHLFPQNSNATADSRH